MTAMGDVVGDCLPPPPPSSGAPGRWGDATAVETLLSDAGGVLRSADQHQVKLRFSDASEAADFLIDTAGHIISHRSHLVATGRWQALAVAHPR